MPNSTTTLTDDYPLDVSDAARIRELDAVLRRHNYTLYGLLEALGEDPGATLKEIDLPIYERRLGTAPLHHLIRLFQLGLPVARETLIDALAPVTPQTLVELGLVTERDGQLTSPYRVMVFENLYLVCDRYLEGDALWPDFVTGVNSTSIALAALTVRRGGRALDLGTGCGVQALLASRHCETVVATDVSPRALTMTQFNAALNGIANVECRQGSLFEPVEGEQFDLIVCNPPYVISPRTDYIFRDAGLSGDAVSQTIISQAGSYLSPGGYATILCDWAHERYGDWSAPLRGWVAESGCDALFLRRHVSEPWEYAVNWLRQPAPADAASMSRHLEEWLAYYAEQGIEAISGGAVVLRRSDGPHWAHGESLPIGRLGPSSEHIQRLFAAHDYLRSLPNPSVLLDTVLMPVDGRVHQTLVQQDGGWRVADTRVDQTRGLGFESPLDVLAIHLMMSLDGQQPLRPLIARAARESGVKPREVLEDMLGVVYHWVQLGLVVPVQRG